MYDLSQTLIIVYKNEMLLNQIKKLIETRDDDNKTIVGIKDGSVKVVSWSERVWLEQKKAGNINSKVLYIDEVKGVEKLIPVLDVMYDKYGSKFGWAGNQAVIFTDISVVNNHEIYEEFLVKLSELPISASLKENKKAHFEVKKVRALDRIAKGIQSVFDNKNAIREQLLIYSIFQFYYLGLKDFIEA